MSKKHLQITVFREEFGEDYTAGKLYLRNSFANHNGELEFFCYTLEDAARAYGIKVPGKTCVPEGECFVTISKSNRFQRDMLLLYTEFNDYSLQLEGTKFTGIRPHGGNDVYDTEGCPLVAYNRNDSNKSIIWRSAERDLFTVVKSAIDDGYTVNWSWIHQHQST